MTWNCLHCNEEMNLRMVQQGGMHVYCYPEWFDKEIPVWKIEHDGSSYVEDVLGNIQDILEDMDNHSYYKITKFTMKQGVYKNLPEFTGF